ncbi:PH domain-containing protein [Salinimicrobium sp. GXAS 041]|uniref:PH domain-containing protein n=1 Tax=Salinimicrobium sp. GXAS 041 TaxID=3400806 RepID=UPI003C71D69B
MDSIEHKTFKNEVLAVDSIPKYEEVALISFAPAYLWKRNITTSIWLVFVAIAIVIAYWFGQEFRMFVPYAVPVFILVFTWSYVLNYQWFKKSGYALRERDIIYKRGFLFEKTTVIPFNRVQHVSTNRGVLDKMLDLSTLNVFTAGGSGSDVALPGLKPATADSLKEALAARMSGHV